MDNKDLNNKNNNKPTTSNNGYEFFRMFMTAISIVFIINIVSSVFELNKKLPIKYNEFIELVESGNIKEVSIDYANQELIIHLNDDFKLAEINNILKNDDKNQLVPAKSITKDTVFLTGLVDNSELSSFLDGKGVIYSTPTSNKFITFALSWVMPLAILFLFYMISSNLRRTAGDAMGGAMSIGKSGAKMYDKQTKTGITFKDVAGLAEAKESLDEIVDFLHNPEKYAKIGAKLPKGALLVGPPGTGKTLLAKAVAGEADVPFLSLSGSEFVEMFVGVGAKRVRDLFEQAKKNSPCIIFIDEIDAIGKKRDNQMGGNDEREQTLNQLLAEMDGFDSTKAIIVLAATNRPETLDKALLRPGRFDRRIIVDKPDLPGREAILNVHAKSVKMDEAIDLKQIAFATSGASGADLANMINEAALHAIRMNHEAVMQEDIMEAVETVIAGKEKRDRILSPKEKNIVAYHEIGHALASALQKNSSPVQKITIIPRTMGSLGYTMSIPEEERYLYTKDELIEEIVVLVAGRAAEQVVFGEISTGASNDIERATNIARNMVTIYGMSDKFNMVGLESIQNQYLDGRRVPLHSEATGADIDTEVKHIINDCYNTAINLLNNNIEKLKELATYLYDKETITGDQFMEILKK